MSSETKPERIRVNISIEPESPAYALLNACPTLAARRSATLALVNSAAAAIAAGFVAPTHAVGPVSAPAPVLPKPAPGQARARIAAREAPNPTPSATEHGYTAGKSSALNSILDFDAL
jgi:cell division septation protein DedD